MEEASQISTVKAFKWNVIDQVSAQAINFISNIIMVRLLSPDDFGLFAIPFVLLMFSRTIQDLGAINIVFKEAIPSKKLLRDIYGFILTLTILLSIFLYFAGAALVELWTSSPQTGSIVKYLTIGFIMSTPMVFHEAVLKKNMAFKKLFYTSLISTFISAIVGITMAMQGYSFWSLVAKQNAFIISNSLLMMWALKWKAGIGINFKNVWKHKSFTIPLAIDQTIAFFVRNLDSVLVGRFIGVTSLGLYDRAYRFLTLPIQQIGGAFSRVMLPALSNETNPKKLHEKFLVSAQMVSLLLFPLMLGLFVLSDEFVKVVLNEKWDALVPLLQIFSILACFQTISSLTSNLFLISGKTKQMLNFTLLTKPVYVVVFVVATLVNKDIYLLALFYAIVSILSSLPFWHLACKSVNIRVTSLLEVIFPQLICSIIMAACILICKENILVSSMTIQFCILVLIGILSYFLLIYFTKNKAFYIAKDLIKQT